MKAIKNLCLFCFLIFGILMQSEIFQDQLWNFSTAYFTSSRYEVASEDMSQFLKDVSETATENDVHIFSQYNEINNKYLSTLHIYGDDKVIRQTLKNTANIEESEYTALVSGITKVKFHNLSELQSTSVGYENFISYIGNEDNIISAYQKLSEKYSLTYPEYWNSTEKDMIFIIWGMIIALMIVLNVIEVVRRKKEVVVRVSLGESAGFIAFKAALFDVTFDIALFIVAKILLSNYISGAYENRLVTILYSIGIILSTIPYCSFCFFDIRKAFANATHKRGVDFLIYSLKFIAGVAAVFTITTNISSIHNNLFTNEHLLEEYYDANYFTVKTTDFNAEKEEAFSKTGCALHFWLLLILFVSMCFLSFGFGSHLSSFYFWMIVLLVVFFIPFYILLKIREEHLQSLENLDEQFEWMAFRNMIESIPNFNQAELESVVLWNRILVYATMYGQAKKVSQVLKNHQISLPYENWDTVVWLTTSSNSFLDGSTLMSYADDSYSVSSFSTNSSDGSGGFDGGGFSDGGGGGGFGAF